MKKFSFILIILFTFFLNISAIEVGGHLTEDTIWSPENNPYLVTSGVYVDSDVTLTILPGTIVKFNSDYYDDLGDDQFYFHSGEEPIAKFIRVEGRIIAEGTEQDSIIFTRMQDVEYYHWGTIYLPEGAPKSSFRHCVFEFSAFTGFSLWEQPRAAIAMWNGSAMIDKCDFIDNDTAIYIRNNVTAIQITNNYYDYIEYPHPNIISVSGYDFISAHYISNNDIESPLIAGNTFKNGTAIHSSKSVYFVSNSIESVALNRKAIYLSSTDGINYFYNNAIGSCSTGIVSGSNGMDSLYIKKNNFVTDGGEGINIDDAYVEVSDNYFENCRLILSHSYYSKIINNIIVNKPEPISNPAISGNVDVIKNNIVNNCGVGLSGSGATKFSNNIISNNHAICSFLTDISVIENEIIIGNDEIFLHTPSVNGYPIFRNCILDFELPEGCIDGGGNIWVDSLQVQELFEDIENGDFHLIEGSLAIDAGFDTLGYYYPFDIDYNHRVWDGDNNGSAIIDIGPYEFGSPSFGGIEGYTYNPSTGDAVDYVLLKINNQPGEFTFSDNNGNFEYKFPAGIYDVYAERVFYEDVIEYQVEVIDGEFTNLFIPMFETVDVIENDIIQLANDLNLTNFPNPFNPSTTISFSVTQNSDFVNLEVYNIKGQKVKTLINEEMQKGNHSIIWSGLDSNNKSVSSGIYLYQLNVDNKPVANNKMLLIK